MTLRLYTVGGVEPGRLSTMARPQGGTALARVADELHARGVRLVVSALEEDEAAWMSLEREGELLEAAGIDFFPAPIPDHRVPSVELARQVAETTVASLDRDQHVVIHCYGGIGRSSLLAACALMLRGIALADALKAIGRARGMAVPETPEQFAWLERNRDAFGVSGRG